ncbi:hypothetical protein C1645_817024 [Glomus cerebriforme]|uniref:Uncharacterized protein n=1 Tax=Glomus cerebriforme TaxID=658196 RepID=A0A397TAB1_9GLOM|nr:hypothetical protein C1645_817024 [Glomus cerebriforme]
MEISSGSTSTKSTNDNSILKPITIPDDQPIQPQSDQLQELMHLDNPDDDLPKPVTPSPASINKEKQPNKKKNKVLTPHIITGYTIPPNLKKNVRDVMLYDIPGNWDAERITEEINKHLGSLIKASVIAKDKYRCDIPVCWFPGDWFLAQRQQYIQLGGHQTGENTQSRTKSPDKKSRGSNDTSKKSKHFSKDSKKKNKPKSQTSSASSTGSIAEVLATLVKLLTKQETKKSRNHSKSHGSSKAN